MSEHAHKVVIVGGGAGGLELAAKLGRRFGPDHIFLVDKDMDHIWKPSLHEVAAGTLDIHREGLSYAMLAQDCGFTFIYGRVQGVDRSTRTVLLEPALADGEVIFPERRLDYDTLVMAVGSRSNFFGTPGAAEHASALDSTEQAERFRKQLLRYFVLADQRRADDPDYVFNITIVGGGATGVELAAELLEACKHMVYYGLNRLDPSRNVKITLLEGADRILSALTPKMSASAQSLLLQRGIEVRTSVRVASVDATSVTDAGGVSYPSDLCVWAAGIEAPDFLANLGLPVNQRNQLIVDAQLRTEDPDIFAIGDCCQAPWGDDGSFLPARAQVAHQQASYLIKLAQARIQGTQPDSRPFHFRDYGSLVSVGHSHGVGSLMGVLVGKSWFVEGLIARVMYMSLHLMHHMAVLGMVRTGLMAAGRMLLKRSAPRVKLH